MKRTQNVTLETLKRNLEADHIYYDIDEEINKMVFILYLRNFSGISGSIYGGVSAIIVLMAFIYISAIILLIGAQITARFTVYLSVRKLNKQNKILKLSLDRLN